MNKETKTIDDNLQCHCGSFQINTTELLSKSFQINILICACETSPYPALLLFPRKIKKIKVSFTETI